MAGSGGKLTKWLVNKTVVEPTKRKVEAAKTKVTKSTAAQKVKAVRKTPGKCEICGGKCSPRHNLCGKPSCAQAFIREAGKQ